MRLSARVVAALLALCSLIVYLVTVAPDMLVGDSGEFQFAAPLLGIVHPTGYPLYLVLAKLFTLIPVGSSAYRVNLFSAVCAALAVGACYLVSLQLLDNQHNSVGVSRSSFVIRHSSALVAALTLALSFTFWTQATEAEVYALNSLFVISLIGLSVVARQTGQARAWLLLALVFGLSLAHHRSIILLVPALMTFLVADGRWQIAQSQIANRKLQIVFLLLAPLLLYLYTPLRYNATPYTHIALDAQHVITTLDDTPQAFIVHAFGVGFGGALRWDARAWERLLSTPLRVLEQVGLIGMVFSGLGLLWIVRMREWGTLLLLMLMLAAYALFNALYQIGDIADFYTPLYIAVALLIGQGVMVVGRAHWGAALAMLALPLALLLSNFVAMRQHDDVRTHWSAVLSSDVPQNAILISNDRDEMTPLYYLQFVEHVRPDLLPLFPLISLNFPNVVALTQYALETSRPIYFIKPMDSLSVKFRMQNEGALQRVLGLQDFTPTHPLARESALLNFVGWSVDDGRMLTVTLFWQAQSITRPDLKTYAHVVNAEGKIVAQSDHIPGGEFYPPSQWATGEVLRDQHPITLPNDSASVRYQLIVGAYLPDGRGVDGVARMELGTLSQ